MLLPNLLYFFPICSVEMCYGGIGDGHAGVLRVAKAYPGEMVMALWTNSFRSLIGEFLVFV